MNEFRMLYVTAKDREEARLIGRTVVEERLAACANLLGDIESYYHWEGRLENGSEVALLLKTRLELEPALIDRVRSLHSYSCPAIVSLPIVAGHQPFLGWLVAETTKAP
jgi:periplasmic divalent cation tolerance protein